MRAAIIILLLFASCSTGNNPGITNAVKPGSLQGYPLAASAKIVRGKIICQQHAWSDVSKTEISNCIQVITVYKGDVKIADTLVFRLAYSNDSTAAGPPALKTESDYILFFSDVSTGSSSCGGTRWHPVYELTAGDNIKEYDSEFEKRMLEQLKQSVTK